MSFAPHHILVPVAIDTDDDVSLAEQAVMTACDLAEKFDAKITLVHFASTLPVGAPTNLDVTGHVFDTLMKILQARFNLGRLKLEELQKEARARGIKIEGRVIDSIESTAHVIVDTAAELDADLLVMCSHGRQGLSKMLFGSVAAKVAELASMPVLLLHQSPSKALKK